MFFTTYAKLAATFKLSYAHVDLCIPHFALLFPVPTCTILEEKTVAGLTKTLTDYKLKKKFTVDLVRDSNFRITKQT